MDETVNWVRKLMELLICFYIPIYVIGMALFYISDNDFTNGNVLALHIVMGGITVLIDNIIDTFIHRFKKYRENDII